MKKPRCFRALGRKVGGRRRDALPPVHALSISALAILEGLRRDHGGAVEIAQERAQPAIDVLAGLQAE
jgi:hypothetical protein